MPSDVPSEVPSDVPSDVPSVSFEPSNVPSDVPSVSSAPSDSPSNVPSGVPSDVPSNVPSLSSYPSSVPSNVPSEVPSSVPSGDPTGDPSQNPSLSAGPSSSPSDLPSAMPSSMPSLSNRPSLSPSDAPSSTPSNFPSNLPSSVPSKIPSVSPSDKPSTIPSTLPSVQPSTSAVPSIVPTDLPSVSPSNSPSSTPSVGPSVTPSASPSGKPSNAPSAPPTGKPSNAPSKSIAPSNGPTTSPSQSPSSLPSKAPSDGPTEVPSVSPSFKPSFNPTGSPSGIPSRSPTISPSQSPTISPSFGPSFSMIPSTLPTFVLGPIPESCPSQDDDPCAQSCECDDPFGVGCKNIASRGPYNGTALCCVGDGILCEPSDFDNQGFQFSTSKPPNLCCIGADACKLDEFYGDRDTKYTQCGVNVFCNDLLGEDCSSNADCGNRLECGKICKCEGEGEQGCDQKSCQNCETGLGTDICFAIDNSGSICSNSSPCTSVRDRFIKCNEGGFEQEPNVCGNYLAVKTFTKDVVDQLKNIPDQTFSAAFFGSDVNPSTNIQKQNGTAFNNALDLQTFIGGTTNTQQGLQTCSEILSPPGSPPDGKDKLIILITDGNPTACGSGSDQRESSDGNVTCVGGQGLNPQTAAESVATQISSLSGLRQSILPVGVKTPDLNVTALELLARCPFQNLDAGANSQDVCTSFSALVVDGPQALQGAVDQVQRAASCN